MAKYSEFLFGELDFSVVEDYRFKGAKIQDSNIAKIFEYTAGHAPDSNDHGLLFLHDDGTLSYITIDDLMFRGNYSVRQLSGVENVSDVEHGSADGGAATFAILEDGTKVDLGESIRAILQE